MAKTRKQIIEDLKLIDIVAEVLDARIPISSQNPDYVFSYFDLPYHSYYYLTIL